MSSNRVYQIIVHGTNHATSEGLVKQALGGVLTQRAQYYIQVWLSL